MTTTRKPGRRAVDGAVGVRRVNIALTAEHHDKLKQLAGAIGVSAWLRKIIDKEHYEAQSSIPASH